MSESVRSIVLLNRRSEIERLVDFVAEFGRAHGLAEDDVMNATLVLDEAVVNTIVHGYGNGDRDGCGRDEGSHSIDVRLALDRDLLRIDVEDDGIPFDPRDAPAPQFDVPIEDRPIGGLGVHIVRSIAHSIDYTREHGRNHLTMTLKLEGRE